jgi:two-component system, NtrC family, sensor kinase
MPYALSRFGFTDLMDCRNRIRGLFTNNPPSFAEAAEQAVDFFHRELVDDQGRPACSLVRFFKTHPYGDLGPELQRVARDAGHTDLAASVRCLTLLATRGEQPEWNSREQSRGHRIIPLVSVEMVQQAPMISQMITQMGVNISTVVKPDRELLLDATADTTYNVFYVPRAMGSPYIVAQNEFVIPHRIASVLGFGGMLTSGDLFAVIIFSNVPISPDVADQFRVIGLNLKVAILPFARKPLFPERDR